tara:strand:+ start:538 stop:738 length:201 start_codon:yes stop_codon:yes gene_type:complete
VGEEGTIIITLPIPVIQKLVIITMTTGGRLLEVEEACGSRFGSFFNYMSVLHISILGLELIWLRAT